MFAVPTCEAFSRNVSRPLDRRSRLLVRTLPFASRTRRMRADWPLGTETRMLVPLIDTRAFEPRFSPAALTRSRLRTTAARWNSIPFGVTSCTVRSRLRAPTTRRSSDGRPPFRELTRSVAAGPQPGMSTGVLPW